MNKKNPDHEENTQNMYLLRNQDLLVPGRDPQTISLELYESFLLDAIYNTSIN